MRLIALFTLAITLVSAAAYAACTGENGVVKMGTTYMNVCNNGTDVNIGCGNRGSCTSGEKGRFRTSGSKVQYCNGSNWTDFSNSECASVPGASASCTLPWGGSISHGASTTAYAIDDGFSCGAFTCSNMSETRTCNNGVLSGSYQFGSCTEDACCGSEPC